MISLIVNSLVAILLVAALVGGVILHRALTRWQSQRADLQPVISALSQAVDRTHDAIHGLRAAALEADAKLAQRVDEAAKLATELNLLSGVAEAAAQRVEQAHAPRLAAGDFKRADFQRPEPKRTLQGMR
jgi:Domain of unknown function (DUF6468)